MRDRKLLRRAATIIGAGVSAAAAGVIGNRVDANLDKILPILAGPYTLHGGVGILIILLCVTPGLVFSLTYAAALEISSGINKLDESLLRLLPNLYQNLDQPDIRDQLEKAARNLFVKLSKIKTFSNCGVAIYLPNSTRTYLATWSRYASPNETEDSLTFFIGDEQRKNAPTGSRGVAGTVYIECSPMIVHIDKDGNADNNVYVPSPGGNVRYRSLVCVPVTGETESDVLGVLCLYSEEKSTFDGADMLEILSSIALRFTPILLLLRNVR